MTRVEEERGDLTGLLNEKETGRHTIQPETAPIEVRPSTEARESERVNSEMITRAWDVLLESEQKFVVRSLLRDDALFDTLIDKQKSQLMEQVQAKKQIGQNIKIERGKIMHAELMHGMRKILQAGDPRGESILHSALEIAHSLELSETDKKTLRDNAQSPDIEEIKQQVKKRFLKEQGTLVELLQERIDALKEEREDAADSPEQEDEDNENEAETMEIPEGPPEEFLSRESWEVAYKSGLSWTSIEVENPETEAKHTRYILFLDPNHERFDDVTDEKNASVQKMFSFNDQLAAIENNTEFKRLEDKKRARETLLEETSWKRARETLAEFVSDTIKNNIEGEAVPHDEAEQLTSKASWQYPSQAEAGAVLAALKKFYPSQSIGIYTSVTPDSPNPDHQLAYLQTSMNRADQMSTKRIISESKRPHYQEQNIEILPVVSFDTLVAQKEKDEKEKS